MDLYALASRARAASYLMMTMDSAGKDDALRAMADALVQEEALLLSANARDLDRARKNGMASAMLDRLALDSQRIQGMAEGLRSLATAPDPVGGADEMIRRPNGLLIAKRRVPLGVVGIIYEARPNVTADAAGICLKSGNVCILRGGSEAIDSNTAIVEVLSRAAEESGLPGGCIGLVTDTSHETAAEMMSMHGWIDVLIPRGSAKLINSVVENARIPVIETGAGNCHIYVEADADLDMARRILINAKCSRPSVCNAAETLLLHTDAAEAFLLATGEELRAKGVEIRGDKTVCKLLPWAVAAGEDDWYEEYNDYILAVKVVDNFDEAVSHINAHNTKHSEAIITRDYRLAQRFLDEVDAAAVYVNASTRFTDGEEFGMGAEIGISTQKLHARGPMGLHEMTTYKYCIYGDGQIR